MSTWDMIKSERTSFADALASLPADAWDGQSLASQWAVRDVVAHMIATAQMTPPKFFGAMIGSGFNFQAMTAKKIAGVKTGKSDAELTETYRSLVDARSAPPGPAATWLGETIVHGEDVFRSLGTYRPHPVEHVVEVADFYSRSNLLIGAKKLIEGVTLRATDRLVAWLRPGGKRSGHRARDGNDRSQGGAGRPQRSRRGRAALATVTTQPARNCRNAVANDPTDRPMARL
jgi:hypothetical protein